MCIRDSIQDQIEALQGKKPSAPPSPSATSHIGTGPVAIAIACAGTAVGAFLADQAFTGGNDAPVSYTHLDVYKRQSMT